MKTAKTAAVVFFSLCVCRCRIEYVFAFSTLKMKDNYVIFYLLQEKKKKNVLACKLWRRKMRGRGRIERKERKKIKKGKKERTFSLECSAKVNEDFIIQLLFFCSQNTTKRKRGVCMHICKTKRNHPKRSKVAIANY